MDVAQTLKSQSRIYSLPRVKNFMFISDPNPLPNISIGTLRHQTGTTNYRSTTPNASRIRLPNPPVHAKPALGSNAANRYTKSPHTPIGNTLCTYPSNISPSKLPSSLTPTRRFMQGSAMQASIACIHTHRIARRCSPCHYIYPKEPVEYRTKSRRAAKW